MFTDYDGTTLMGTYDSLEKIIKKYRHLNDYSIYKCELNTDKTEIIYID